MAEVQQEKIEETKTKAPSSEFSQSRNKHSLNRMANKQRKKRAHRRSLRKSNANG
jgi:hypothetical protein